MEYQIPFHSVPVQLHVPVTTCSDSSAPLVDAEVNKRDPILNREFLQQNFSSSKKRGNVSSCNPPESSKQVSGELPFLNGKYLLSQIPSKKERLYDMYRLKGCTSLSPRTQILPKVPLIPVENQNIRRQGVPFGLNTAPRVFTKLIKRIPAYLRKRGIQIIFHLDDFLILGSSIEESKANTWKTLTLLQRLGLTINMEKSVLEPT